MIEPAEGLPPDILRSRRERALERLARDVLVLPSATPRYASRDTEYPYRPDSELFYLTGVTEPGAVALLRGHADEDRFVLFVRPRDEEAELWTGPRRSVEEAAEAFGADRTFATSELEERLPGLLEGADRIHFRLGAGQRVEGLVRLALERARIRGQRKGEGPRGVIDPGVVLDPMRRVKDELEIERIRRAAAISAEAHRRVIARTRPGMGEWELQALLEETFRARGGEGPAYGTIVASGPNACTLHYVANRDTLRPGELVLVDAGASYGLYAGDLTRTFPADGAFTPEQRAVYEVVERARARAVETVRPGVGVDEVHGAAVRALVEGLVDLDVVTGEVDDLVEVGAHEPFFPHRTSHWLGLDVHDPGDYAVGGEAVRLEPGMVLTVEPGLYFRGGSAASGGRFEGIGVRIEDDVVVTGEGREVLTGAVPTDPDRIEELVGSEG